MNKIRQFREQAGLTQLDMAKRLGISESYYCQLETGKRRLSLDNALQISSVLKKTPNEIFLPDSIAKRKVSQKARAEQAATYDPTGTG